MAINSKLKSYLEADLEIIDLLNCTTLNKHNVVEKFLWESVLYNTAKVNVSSYDELDIKTKSIVIKEHSFENKKSLAVSVCEMSNVTVSNI